MNILFLTNSVGFGGAEKMLAFVANGLCKIGNQIYIANFNSVPQYVTDKKQIFDSSITIYSIETKNGNKHIQRIKAIKQLVVNKKIEVIIGFTMFPNFYGKIVSILTKVPSIMSERGDPYVGFTNSIADKIILFFINSSKGAVFQTVDAARFYSKKLQRRGIVIPNAIELPDNFVKKQNIARLKTVVSVGRFQNVQKRYDIMLKSFALFAESHPDYILKLYGSGDDILLIKQWSKDFGISDKVKFMGVVYNAPNVIKEDGMFLITSDYEGIPNALLEAMAAGLPVISTDCSPGGAKMLINDHENGLLVPVRDIKAIANAMTEFANNRELSEKCSKNAQKVVNKFAPQKIIQQWIEYINKFSK